jgi:hypothetical protein
MRPFSRWEGVQPFSLPSIGSVHYISKRSNSNDAGHAVEGVKRMLTIPPERPQRSFALRVLELATSPEDY